MNTLINVALIITITNTKVCLYVAEGLAPQTRHHPVVTEHALDLLPAQPAPVGGRDVQETVGVENDLDLRPTPRGRWDAREVELAEVVAVLGRGTFSHAHLDGDSGLAIIVGGEGLGPLGRGGHVPLDQGDCLLRGEGFQLVLPPWFLDLVPPLMLGKARVW